MSHSSPISPPFSRHFSLIHGKYGVPSVLSSPDKYIYLRRQRTLFANFKEKRHVRIVSHIPHMKKLDIFTKDRWMDLIALSMYFMIPQ
jgi:hypothetical protein